MHTAHRSQTKISEALVPLLAVLMKSYHAVTTSWRSDHNLFTKWDDFLKGCLNMSPAWFQMGHVGGDTPPEVLMMLKCSAEQTRGRNWLEQQAEIEEVVGKWESVFNAVSVIINRQSPYHRDLSSLVESLDLLATVSDDTNVWMVILMLRTSFEYSPGMVMAFSGHLLWHGVNQVDGNRRYLAYYMQSEVIKWAGLKAPSFMWYEVLHMVGLPRNSHWVYSP
ncbi:hypothetical protein JVU11DRAFT_11385 [Chiua virens]|nr:hypothetical protein JVU11DRAFT_11385 [Chiua virens]